MTPLASVAPVVLVVLVDMDNVLADLDAHFTAIWGARHLESPGIGVRRNHRVVDDLPAQLRPEGAAILAEPGFTAGMPVIQHAREALTELVDHGFLVYVCTSPLSARSPNAAEKLDWVEDNLGAEWRHRTIITKDKTLVRGDLLIDDALTVTGAMTPTWRHVVFDRPFNLDADAPARMSWSTWRDALLPEEHRP